MTKTLTEQWRDGTLQEGCYYIRAKKRVEEKIVPFQIIGPAFFYDQNVLLEIVEPVPSYDEYRELLDLNVYEKDRKKVMGLEDKVKRLQKQLKIAKKAFVDILCDGDDYWDKDKAQEALTKMKGVK